MQSSRVENDVVCTEADIRQLIEVLMEHAWPVSGHGRRVVRRKGTHRRDLTAVSLFWSMEETDHAFSVSVISSRIKYARPMS